MKKFYNIHKNCYNTKSLEEIKSKVQKHNINTITMGFSNLYGSFVGKKYDSDYFVDKVIKNGSNACNYLLSCDLGFNPLPNAKISSYERGFGDFTMRADINSYREINYINNSKQLLFFSDLNENEKDSPILHNPRFLLKKSISDLNKFGVFPLLQCEMNFNVFYDNYKKNEKKLDDLKSITEHSNLHNTLYKNNFENFFKKMKNSFKTSNIVFEGIKGDESHGQFRVLIGGSDPVEFCDNVVLMKLIMKKLADEDNKTISFMAKINPIQNGNCANLKILLKDSQNKNLLQDVEHSEENGTIIKNKDGENVIAGIEKHLNDFIIFYGPTINSYKRFRENDLQNYWNKFGFMQENCGLNLMRENNENKLLFKIAGSDVNPYLTVFSLITSMISGLKNRLNLKSELENLKEQRLPINLNKSVAKYDKNQFLKEILGEEIHYHFTAFYSFEFAEYMNQVDDWERNRYFYQI